MAELISLLKWGPEGWGDELAAGLQITLLLALATANARGVVLHLNNLENLVVKEALLVEAWDRSERNRLAQGILETIDNQIDTTTGSIRLRATLAEPGEAVLEGDPRSRDPDPEGVLDHVLARDLGAEYVCAV